MERFPIRNLGSYLYTYVFAHGLLEEHGVHEYEHRRLQFTHICADRWRAVCAEVWNTEVWNTEVCAPS